MDEQAASAASALEAPEDAEWDDVGDAAAKTGDTGFIDQEGNL